METKPGVEANIFNGIGASTTRTWDCEISPCQLLVDDTAGQLCQVSLWLLDLQHFF